MFTNTSGLGLTAKDMNVLEVHDCFSIAEVLMYEALGLAEYGKGTHFVADGHPRTPSQSTPSRRPSRLSADLLTDIEGKFPVNTGGGLIGFGHPVGATGVKQVCRLKA